MKRASLPTLIYALGITFSAGALGSFATFPSIPGWYARLNKSPLNPPNWVFGPVWTTLYILMSIAFYLVKTAKAKKAQSREAAQFYVSQLIFNALWSIVFFGFHAPALAVGVIVALWLLILFTLLRFYAIKKTAAFLLAPYILWVSFAAVLNLSLALLNP